MSDRITKTVTHEVEVDPRIADLVRFGRVVQRIALVKGQPLDDARLVELADDFWDTQHGED